MSDRESLPQRLLSLPGLRQLSAFWRSLTWTRRAVGLATLVVVGIAVVSALRVRPTSSGATIVTVGEIEAVHAEVRLGKREVRGIRRFSVGDALATGGDGRARIRFDDGTIVVVDRATELEVTAAGLQLNSGRLFARNGSAARQEVSAGAVTTVVSASAVAFEKKGDDARIYSADGELVVRAGKEQNKVRSGESAVFSAGKLSVVPEKAFNDWTGGMATPWTASAGGGSAVGQLIGRATPTEGGQNLAIRSHEIAATLDGEVAMTHVETTFFNGTSASATGDFRMATPPGAIVSRFALRRFDSISEGSVVARGPTHPDTLTARLEWAGPGWLRGYIPEVNAGETIGVIVDYVEWLPIKDGHMTYRYPMASDATAPLIGELRARIDTHGAKPRSITVGKGATVTGDVVEVRKADLRPEADLVVELEVPEHPANKARAYTVPAGKGEHNADPYFMVRTELPASAAPAGVTLALVVDTSWSISPALLEVERAVVESLVEGLGARDRVALFAADQDVHPLGAAGLGAVDDARRAAIRDSLAKLRSGGASDLGAALEQAANTLPSDAPDAMVVYIGDGWPTLGDPSAEALRARLARRPGGVPRLGAVAIGPLANRFGLSALVRDSGPVLVALDRVDAANLAISLLVGALDSATSGVELDLGPHVDRVYPRGASTVKTGESVTVVGRLRGEAPSSVVLRYRRGDKVVEESRSVVVKTPPSLGDVRRRWASERVADITLRGKSIETAADAAEQAKLLTPWSFWSLSTDARYMTPLAARLLDSFGASQAMPPASLSMPERSLGSLLEPKPPAAVDESADFEVLMSKSVHRSLRGALPGIRRCRDARRSLRPEIGGTFLLRFSVDGRGRASNIRVNAKEAVDDDLALDRCVASLIGSLPFFDSETTGSVAIQEEIVLAPHETATRRCSATSSLPLALRPIVWQRRLVSERPEAVFQRASRECELATWIEQRALLELMLTSVPGGLERIALAATLELAGVMDAAGYIRDAAIARAKDPTELAAMRQALIGDEPEPGATFVKQYKEAKDDEARLGVTRRFLRASPHSPALRRLLFALLEALDKKDVLAQEIADVRRDPFADGELLADGASALGRIGRTDDARRAFAELIERAPDDPYARAYAGHRLRDEGLFDDATTAYEALAQMLPGDPAAAMSLALAHAGAGRMDVAARVLQRVGETGGRANDQGLGELAGMTAAVLLTDARDHASGDEARRLEQRALELPLPDLAGFVLVQTPDLEVPVEARLVQGDEKLETPPDLAAPSLGLYALRLERGAADVRIRLRRPLALAPERGVAIRVDVLSLDRETGQKKLVEKRIQLSANGKDTELRFAGGELQ